MHKSSLPPTPLSCAQSEKPGNGRRDIAKRATALVGAIALSAAGLAGLSVPAHALTDGGVGAVVAPALFQDDAAQTEQREVADAEITWGIRTSFRNYLLGFAKGTVEGTGGAVSESGIITWSNGAGQVDAGQLSGEISFNGGVSYRGHEGLGPDGGYGLNVDFANPTIKFERNANGVTGVLYLDAFANPFGNGSGIDAKQVAFANLTFSDDFAVEDNQLSGTAQATLHEDGVEAFIGMYDAGSALDDISFSATLVDPAPEVVEVAPAAPLQADSIVTIPEVEGIEYVVNGQVVSSGELELESGVPVTVTARAEEGYTLTEGSTSEWTFEYEAPVVAEASLTVTPSSDLDPNGQTVTIRGSGFDTSADAPPYLPTNKAGFYVQIGWLDDEWRPSEGAQSSARSNAYSVWVQDTNADAPYMLWEEAEDGTASFTWEVEIDKATLDEEKRDGAQLAVFTIGAGGQQQPMNEKVIPISFADEAETPEPGETETPEPGETETPEPDETEAPEPGETDTPDPEETETPEPDDNQTSEPTPSETETPKDNDAESPSADDEVHSVEDLTEGNRGNISVPASAKAGETITVNVGETYAGLQVDPVLFSDPFVLDTVTVSDDGSIQFTLPKNVTGEHDFAVYFAGESGADNVLGWSTITISAAEGADQKTDDTANGSDKTTTAGTSTNEADNSGGLAKTGAEPAIVAIGGLLLLVAGGIALVASRARRNGTQQ